MSIPRNTSSRAPVDRTSSKAADHSQYIWVGAGTLAGFLAVVLPGILVLASLGRETRVESSAAPAMRTEGHAPPDETAEHATDATHAATDPRSPSPHAEPPAPIAVASSDLQYPMTAPRVARQQEKLKEIALAMNHYRGRHKRFPIADDVSFFDKELRPYLSWRVHLLPYLGHTPLWNEFRPNEPWDSANNLPLLAKIPDVFLDEQDPWHSTHTRILALTGPNTLFPTGKGLPSAELTDPPGDTIVAVRVGRGKAVPWTKPEDVVFHPDLPFASLGLADSERLYAAMASTHVPRLRLPLPLDVFQALVTPAGGEIVDWREYTKD